MLMVPCAAGAEPAVENPATKLGDVFVCGLVEGARPLGRAVVFPSAHDRLYCYSNFPQVARQEQVTHRWFFRDREVAQFKLVIQPPRWSSYSSLKISAERKGPWRVEVIGEEGALLGVARFSVVD
jgi:hypothetical protein